MLRRIIGKSKVWLSIDNVKLSDSHHIVYELRHEKNQPWFAQMIVSVKKDEIRLHWIQVESTFQDMGFGSFLINQLVKQKKIIRGSAHAGALRFFAKHGFVPRPSKTQDSLFDIEWNPDWVKLS